MKLADNFFRSSKSSRAHQLLCQESLEDIFTAYGSKQIVAPTLGKYAMTEYTKNPQTIFSWEIREDSNAFSLVLVEYDIQYIKARKSAAMHVTESHLYIFGHLKLNKDYGASYIRPESIKDKLVELFVPVEIDFKEAPGFSSKYYVVSNDKEKFISAVPHKLMTYLQSVKEIEIEFRNKECLFRFEGPIDKSKGLQLCEIGLALDHILNKA